MIQLANDPQANRAGWRASPVGPQAAARQPSRTGHAWPFLSRHAERPAAPRSPNRPAANDSGS